MNRSLLRISAWLLAATLCAAYLLISLAHDQPFHPWGRLNSFDLKVYRGAAQLVLDGKSLYGGPIWSWAPFTYPPFAALVLTPLAPLPLALDEVLVAGLGIVALCAIVSLALRLPSGDGHDAPPRRPWRTGLIPLAAAAALWLEPITATLGYGQINLLIALLVVSDLSRRDDARSKGALIGLAAGLKLTPLIFVPYLLFSRGWRAACLALGTFVATIAAGYAALPGDAHLFWGEGLFFNARRVGGCCVPANQSLRGLILRLDPSFGSGRLLAAGLIAGLAGVTLAVRARRRGDEAAGFCFCALTGLLVSPVSWTHHWTLAVPALLLYAIRAVRRRSTVGIASVIAGLLIGYSYLPKLLSKPAFAPGHSRSVGWALTAAPYVLIGLLALAVAVGREIHRVVFPLAARRTASRRSLAFRAITPDPNATR